MYLYLQIQPQVLLASRVYIYRYLYVYINIYVDIYTYIYTYM